MGGSTSLRWVRRHRRREVRPRASSHPGLSYEFIPTATKSLHNNATQYGGDRCLCVTVTLVQAPRNTSHPLRAFICSHTIVMCACLSPVLIRTRSSLSALQVRSPGRAPWPPSPPADSHTLSASKGHVSPSTWLAPLLSPPAMPASMNCSSENEYPPWPPERPSSWSARAHSPLQ